MDDDGDCDGMTDSPKKGIWIKCSQPIQSLRTFAVFETQRALFLPDGTNL